MRYPKLCRTGLKSVIVTLLIVLLVTGKAASLAAKAPHAPASESNQMHLIVKASPRAAYQSETILSSKKLMQSIKHAMDGPAYDGALPPDTLVIFGSKDHEKQLGVTTEGELVDLPRRIKLVLPADEQSMLKEQVQELRAKHYGEMLPWQQAKEVVPKYSTFTITDVETGQSFQGQRRAGSSHADVQPISKADSAVLKSIYGGAWSWDRRAVLVTLNGRTLAASMHGMPHGGDGIPDNDFNGHFCIHFLGSITHGSRSADPAHQVMVHKAAGLLPEYINRLSPWELIDVWIAAANQGDLQLLQAATGQELALHVRTMHRLSQFPKLDTSALLELQAAVDVSVTPDGAAQPQTKRILFRLERISPTARWYISSANIS